MGYNLIHIKHIGIKENQKGNFSVKNKFSHS